MKIGKWLLMALFALQIPLAYADIATGFVRIACVPEHGLLDIEYRSLHDTVVSASSQTSKKSAASLEKHGFFDPHHLYQKCILNGAEYKITSQQDLPTNRMCGGSPDIHLSVQRNGVALVDDVIFGSSCYGDPSVRLVSLAETNTGKSGREAEICYMRGEKNAKTGTAENCEWLFDSSGDFLNRFPINKGAIERFITQGKS
jgi:hypothetical protein